MWHLSGSSLIPLILLWVKLHFLAPVLLWLALSQTGVKGLSLHARERMTTMENEQRRTLRRLVRSQVYYMIAGPCGAALIARCQSYSDLFLLHTEWHDRFFRLAFAHWFVSFVEDATTPNSLYVETFSGSPPTRRKYNMYVLYLTHHVVAMLAFSACLYTRKMPGMGTCGLCFELPVMFINIRDIIRTAEPQLHWLQPLGGHELLAFCWNGAAVAMVPGRFAPIGLFVYMLWRWSDSEAYVPPSILALHALFGGAQYLTP